MDRSVISIQDERKARDVTRADRVSLIQQYLARGVSSNAWFLYGMTLYGHQISAPAKSVAVAIAKPFSMCARPASVPAWLPRVILAKLKASWNSNCAVSAVMKAGPHLAYDTHTWR